MAKLSLVSVNFSLMVTRDTQIPKSHHIIKVIGDSLLGRLFFFFFFFFFFIFLFFFFLRKPNLSKVQALAETFNYYITLIDGTVDIMSGITVRFHKHVSDISPELCQFGWKTTATCMTFV